VRSGLLKRRGLGLGLGRSRRRRRGGGWGQFVWVVLAVGRWLVGWSGSSRRAVTLYSDNRGRTRSGGFCDLGRRFSMDGVIVCGGLAKEEDGLLPNRSLKRARRAGLAKSSLRQINFVESLV